MFDIETEPVEVIIEILQSRSTQEMITKKELLEELLNYITMLQESGDATLKSDITALQKLTRKVSTLDQAQLETALFELLQFFQEGQAELKKMRR